MPIRSYFWYKITCFNIWNIYLQFQEKWVINIKVVREITKVKNIEEIAARWKCFEEQSYLPVDTFLDSTFALGG